MHFTQLIFGLKKKKSERDYMFEVFFFLNIYVLYRGLIFCCTLFMKMPESNL